MNIRDDRSIGEQARSGLRLAGWVLLTLAIILALLLCTKLVLNTTHDATPTVRVFGVCGLVAISVLMFVSTNYWAKWFFGALGYFTIKAAFYVLFRPHNLLYIKFLLMFLVALVLCGRCILNRSPHNVEKAGLVALVLGLSFSLLLDSARPLLAGVLTLALAHLALVLFRTIAKNG